MGECSEDIVCATWNAVQCFALSSVSKAARLIKKSLKKNPSLYPPLVRGLAAQHPCASPSWDLDNQTIGDLRCSRAQVNVTIYYITLGPFFLYILLWYWWNSTWETSCPTSYEKHLLLPLFVMMTQS